MSNLDRAESSMEEHPELALSLLEDIDRDMLTTRKARARHALLYSMALDKNYIDKTEFEVLQPAIDYYDNNGAATDKLRTYYYQGRIYQNLGNDASAMTCFLKAIEEGGESDDILTKARLYVAQGNIYDSLMEWEEANKANLQAAEYFYKKNRIDSYVNCLLKIFNGYTQIRDHENAKKYLDKCNRHLDEISNSRLGKYYSAYLTHQVVTGDNENIPATIGEYINSVSDANIDYLSIANAYVSINEYDKALEAISCRDYSMNPAQQMRYLTILAGIYENQNNYQKALEAYIKYYELHDAAVYSIFDQDTQFIEERHSLELKNIQEKESKNKVILTCIAIVVILTVIIIYSTGRLKYRRIQQAHAEQEAGRYRLLYQQMEYEKDNLSGLLAQNQSIDSNVKDIVAKRIELLNI